MRVVAVEVHHHDHRIRLAGTGKLGRELIENKQRPGFEEQIDNEKYEVKVRDWDEADKYGISELLTSLNKIRSEHPACRSYHNLHVLPSDDAGVVAFLRQTPAELTGTGKADT